uniref:GrpB family protein n=1 Tax=Peptacetobacter sp. TaxID=2991975 RepID=UPI002635621B
HIYVCNKDNEELYRHITFRDYLRNNKKERDTYSEIKKKMALKYPNDIDSYIEEKTTVILDIYKKCGLE